MQFSIVAVIAALTAGVAAESCNAGGVYCGSSLLHKGNYREHIERVLKKNHQSISEEHIQRSLFDCLKDGEIRYIKYCSKGCGNTDNTKPDYCKK